MLPLLKIRMKYIGRQPCGLIFLYYLIPGIIIFIYLVFVVPIYSIFPSKSTWDEKKEYSYLEHYNLFNQTQSNYSEISDFFQRTSLVVNTRDDGEKITDFIRKKTDVYVDYYLSELEIPKTVGAFIKYDHNIKKDSHEFSFIERDTDDYTGSYPFQDLSLDLIKTTDLFNVRSYYDYDYYDKARIYYIQYQMLFAEYLMEQKKITPQKSISMTYGLNSFPSHYHQYTSQVEEFGYALGIIATIQFSIIFYMISTQIIEEKEQKLQQFLERQGVSKCTYYTSWFLSFLILSFASIISIILLANFCLDRHMIFFILAFFLMLIGLFFFVIFMTSCISTIKAGSTIVKIILFISFILMVSECLDIIPKRAKLLFGLLPQVLFIPSMLCLSQLGFFSSLNWEKINAPVKLISFKETLIMFFADIALYLGLSIFIQSFQNSGLEFISFIKSIFTKVHRETYALNNGQEENIIQNKYEINHQELSPKNSELKSNNRCLAIKNICKYYDDVKAVDNFNVELFEDEIFCLLGHNGAGKSTLIRIISGIEDPTHGDIFLNGLSIVTNKKYLFQNIGVCNQENCFFDYLTVSEQLRYMCEIKQSNISYEELSIFLTNIKLKEKENCLCKELSGGQKRKLCVALAILGNSRIILLDEPTSGMDTVSRMELWQFLKNYKQNKIIVLTTHLLEEVEFLGDRIGIMSNGHFICSGTSSYLKEKYKCGINLNLILNSEMFNEAAKEKLIQKLFDIEPNLNIKNFSNTLISINVQTGNNENQNIKEFFAKIDELISNKENGIIDYTINTTSLEDVFLKINDSKNLEENQQFYKNDIKSGGGATESQKKNNIELDAPNQEQKNENNSKDDINLITNENVNIENFQIQSPDFWKQLLSHLKRGLYPLYRNKYITILELISSLGFIYLFMVLFWQLLSQNSSSSLDFVKIMEVIEKYTLVYDQKDYLKNSYIFNELSSSLSFQKTYWSAETIQEFIENIYVLSPFDIAKSGIYIDKRSQYSNVYEVYNTELPNYDSSIFFSNTMLIVSAYLKNEFNINAVIFKTIEKQYNLSNSDFIDVMNVILPVLYLFGHLFYTGGLIGEKIKERLNNTKHLLYLSGSNKISYWFGIGVVDYIKLSIFNYFTLFSFYFIFNSLLEFLITMAISSFTILPFLDFLSFFGKNEDNGQKTLLILVFGLLIFCICSAPFFYNVLDTFTEPYEINIFDLTPITSLYSSMIKITSAVRLYKEYSISDEDPYIVEGVSPPSKYIQSMIIFQLVHFILYGGLLVLVELGLFGRFTNWIKCSLFISNDYTYSQEEMSNDFVSNSNYIPPSEVDLRNNNSLRINNSNTTLNNTNSNNVGDINTANNTNTNNNQPNINQPLLVNNVINANNSNSFIQNEMNKVQTNLNLTTKIVGLSKTYCFCCRKNIRAVDNLYLGLEQNEKFGLLGFNGSGKTTIFKSITNEILYDTGIISLFGREVSNIQQFNQVRKVIGYCPQENPLFDYMKVKEILQFYSELKNIDGKESNSVLAICKKFNLDKYLETYCKNLSGGNKRKLIFAIALMNKPQILLLDEPSTGVDPESRRIMWKNINELSYTGHHYNMILTTHSMEEAEILCDTISWLKRGNFVCIGNPEKLKIQYSMGYNFYIKFTDLNSNENNNEGNNISYNDVFNELRSLVFNIDRYSNILLRNHAIGAYFVELVKVVKAIKEKTLMITMKEIQDDFSFKLILKPKKDKKSELFGELLNMKNENQKISEITLTMESLENIFTSF